MDLTVPVALARQLRNEFERWIARPEFPCLGARAAVRQQRCSFHVYGPMGAPTTTTALADDLNLFVAGERTVPAFATFVAVFLDVMYESETAFESRLWEQLTQLNTIDSLQLWDSTVNSDPTHPQFAFSFAGCAFFVVGLYPGSSRFARRFSWPVLVFNPHAQFDQLRADGRFISLRDAIRRRDLALQGSPNPNLADFGERSEARQYSGRATDNQWTCPFHPRKT